MRYLSQCHGVSRALRPQLVSVCTVKPGCDDALAKATTVSRGLQPFQQLALGLPRCSSCLSLLAFRSDRQLISCSEDGSVRIWEVREKQQLAAEPVPTGVCLPTERCCPPLPPPSPSSPLLPFSISSDRKLEGDNESRRNCIGYAQGRHQTFMGCQWFLGLEIVLIFLQCETIS